ncbi:hypothetical protein ACFX11_003495 [Malus domestica]
MEELSENCFHEATYLDQEGQLRTSRVPVRFIRVHPEHDFDVVNLSLLNNVSEVLPSISMAKLRARSESTDWTRELGELASGANTWGMLIIKDHGVPGHVLDGVKDVVKEFFGSSFEEKKASVGSYVSVDNMGYGRNFVKSEDQLLDWIDRVTVKAAPVGATQGLHVWPQRPADFRHAIEQYVHEARTILNDLLEALAEALSLEKHVFLQNFDPKDNHALSLTPHSDASALTFLMQFNTARGLQVL